MLDYIDFFKIGDKSEYFAEEIYSNFLVSYLLQSKRESLSVTNLTFSLNYIPQNVVDIESMWCVTFGFVEVISLKRKSAKVKLTNKFYLKADKEMYTFPIIKRTYWKRFKYSIYTAFNVTFKIIKYLKSFIFLLFSKKIVEFVLRFGGVVATIWALIEIYEWALRKI